MSAIIRWAAGAAVAVLAACAPVAPGGAAVPAASPSVVGVHAGVEFYPACGNEELVFNGVHWYSEERDLDATDDDVTGVASPAEPIRGFGFSRGVGGVVAPGPGDDVGTLTVYSNDTAYWVSDSGDLDRWLTTEVRVYNWEC